MGPMIPKKMKYNLHYRYPFTKSFIMILNDLILRNYLADIIHQSAGLGVDCEGVGAGKGGDGDGVRQEECCILFS